MKVFFLVPYPLGESPSQRFRFEQYFVYLKQAGIDYQVSSFIDRDTWSILYNEGHYRAKAFGIIKGFFRRIFSLIQISYLYIGKQLRLARLYLNL
jgi:hypothetical protein